MHEILLRGCSPEPLASYLKALAVLRLVAEQVDPEARGAWRPDGFLLVSTLGEDGLVQFFLDRYVPTPIVAPWNKESGFFPPKAKCRAVDEIRATTDERFAPYRRAIESSRSALAQLGFSENPPDKDTKDDKLLPILRSHFADDVLPWFDAVVALTSAGPQYPRLLGAGGVDCRLEFTNNQMQRLIEVLLNRSSRDPDRSRRCLRAALVAAPEAGLSTASAGQFNPLAGGGANAGPGFVRKGLVNPWDFVLQLEGALLFASAATKRFESGSQSRMAYPFLVEATGSGYAASSLSDEDKAAELWTPIWTAPTSFRELRALFSESRAKVGTRTARNGVDFARAVAMLGVDRGVDSFVRYGFHVRNGQNSLASPLGRHVVRRRKQVDLLAPLDHWLQQLRWKGIGDQAPASVRRGARALEAAIVDLSSGRAARPTDVLITLGEVERALSRSRKHEIAPVPVLVPEWLERADDGSIEFALARSLASTGIRERLVRVRWSKPWQWLDQDDGRTVWGDGRLVENLIAVVEREEVETARGDRPIPHGRPHSVDLTALQAFLEDRTDDARLDQLLRGLAIVDFTRVMPPTERSPDAGELPPAAFALLALARCRVPRPGVELLTEIRINRWSSSDREPITHA
jgi:CRISPR-associated protein Csx17